MSDTIMPHSLSRQNWHTDPQAIDPNLLHDHPDYYHLLTDTESLTLTLSSLTQAPVVLQWVKQMQRTSTSLEMALMHCDQEQHLSVREVILSANDHALIYATSFCSERAHHTHRALLQSNQPIGQQLFAKPARYHASPLLFTRAPVPATHDLLDFGDALFWVRARAWVPHDAGVAHFTQPQAMIVCEYFLPALTQLCHRSIL